MRILLCFLYACGFYSVFYTHADLSVSFYTHADCGSYDGTCVLDAFVGMRGDGQGY